MLHMNCDMEVCVCVLMYVCMYVQRICSSTYVRMTDDFVCGHSVHILVFSLVGAP